MLTQHTRTILEAIPKEKQPELFAAFKRYMEFAGAWEGKTVKASQVRADRQAFADLYIAPRDGHAAIGDDQCAAFIQKVSGLPEEWCRAWGTMEMINEEAELAENEIEVVSESMSY